MPYPTKKLGDTLICPVCGEIFTVTKDHCYIVKNEYVCDWSCFLKHVNEYSQKVHK